MNSSVTETLSMDNGIPIINIPTFESYLGTSSSKNSIFLEDCSQDEICSIIHDFVNSKASDIPIRVIKKSVKVISPLLSYLYNNCMIKGIFPDVLKVGKISPIYKKGNAELLENYRPVSTLPIFGKIFEKIIYSRLYKFCISQNILHKSQFGFRKRHSTCHAINYSVEEIAKYLNNDKHTIGIFIDLSKAFDTINHNKLLRKLSFYGIRGIPHSLISSYLSNRKQFTSVLGEESSLITVEFGVPQGSVLGPLLFLLYINDLIKCSRDASFVLFADDTNIFVTGNTKDEAFITANIVLKSVQHYMSANQLHINLSKSYYIHFDPSRGDSTRICARSQLFDISNSDHYKIKINGTVIKQVTEIKFLGVILDEQLSWEPHIESLCKRLKSNIGVLCRLRDVVPKKLYNSLYHTLFESHISYCISVWGGTGKGKIDKVFILQKKCVRILFGDLDAYLDKYNTCARMRTFQKQILGSEFFRKEPSKPLFVEQNLLTIHNLYIYHCCLEIFKILKFRTPISLNSMVKLSLRKPTRVIIQKRTEFFAYRSAVMWNKLRNRLPKNWLEDFSIKLSTLKTAMKIILLKNQSLYDESEWCEYNLELSRFHC